MEHELISVIVPVYNIERYLPRCLECLSAQTYRNLEIILVDDGSTDRSGIICDEYAARDSRAIVIHQQNQGVWSARNTGQKASSGSYLFFPDGDDYFHRDIIKLLYIALNTDIRYDLAIARVKETSCIYEDVSTKVNPILKEKTGDELIEGLFEKKHDLFYAYMWNKLYRRRLIQNVYSQEYVRSQDFDFNLRVFLCVNKAVLLENDLYYWFQHPGSLTKQSNSMMLMLACRSRLLYRNFMELPDEKVQVGHYLLTRLYKRMILWRAHSLGSNNQQSVLNESKKYEHAVRKAYMACRDIKSFEKMACLFLFYTPRLTRFLMKISKNL